MRCGRCITLQLLIAAMLVPIFTIRWSCRLSLQHICVLLFTSGAQCGTGEIQFGKAVSTEGLGIQPLPPVADGWGGRDMVVEVQMLLPKLE